VVLEGLGVAAAPAVAVDGVVAPALPVLAAPVVALVVLLSAVVGAVLLVLAPVDGAGVLLAVVLLVDEDDLLSSLLLQAPRATASTSASGMVSLFMECCPHGGGDLIIGSARRGARRTRGARLSDGLEERGSPARRKTGPRRLS
jgi:hypothetical protein